jgi:hypothetical protein
MELYRGNYCVQVPRKPRPGDEEIRNYLARGHSQAEACREFGRSVGTVSRIARNVSYKTVPLSARPTPPTETQSMVLEKQYLTAVTDELRASNWTPTREYLCHCTPTNLCLVHAEQRAVDHYHPTRDSA